MANLSFNNLTTGFVEVVEDNVSTLYPKNVVVLEKEGTTFSIVTTQIVTPMGQTPYRVTLKAFDYDDSDLTITPSSTDEDDLYTKLKVIFASVNQGGGGNNEIRELFNNEIERDDYFTSNISTNNPLNTDKGILINISGNLIYQIWGGININDSIDYVNTNWINSGNLTLSPSDIKTLYENNNDTNPFTDLEKTKLSNLNELAEENVQADWNESDSLNDSFILNKPTDITDLSLYNSTNLNDIFSSGSGNIITTIERTKLQGIENNATADQTNIEIRDSLSSLTGIDRLNSSSINNVVQTVNGNDGNVIISTDNLGLGWWNITDTTYTFSSPQSIINGVRTKLIINADSTIDAYSPLNTNINNIWDNINSKITPLSVGDSYVFRLNMTVNPVLNNRNFIVDLDIGGTTGIIFERTIRLARGANVDTKISITNSIFALAAFMANGGDIYITCDSNVDIFDISLFIQKVT